MKILGLMKEHFRSNVNTYIALIIAFVIGISAGAFTVNGLSSSQREELSNYFDGFLKLFGNQKIDSGELLKTSIVEEAKAVLIICVLGLTIIGIPFIFIFVGIRGFITGFSVGFIIEALGTKGVLFIIITLLPKEALIIPGIIALGVNGINFSFKIIKNKSIKHALRENFKTNLLAYFFVTLFYSSFILLGTVLDAYITPIAIRMLAPALIKG